jgi:Ca2+-binding RTX toxin-like protein
MRVALAIVLTLLLPSCAAAAEVSYSDGAGDVTVRIAAAPGEANALTVGLAGRTVTVHDDGAALTASGACQSTGANDVSCAVPKCYLGGSNGCPSIEVDTADADDRVTLSDSGLAPAEIHLGDGADSFTLQGGNQVTVYGDEGDDHVALAVQKGGGAIAQLGGGNDTLDATGAGQVDGRGDAGDDELLGGDGSDQLVGGPGADHVDGRGGSDLALYDASQTTGVSVTLNGMADDGVPGEGDAVVTEGIGGTAAHDVLIGDDGPNLILGFAGDDEISCLGGFDLVVATPITTAPTDCEVVSAGADPAAVQPRAKQKLTVKNGRVKVRFTIREGYVHKKLKGRIELFAADGSRIGKASVKAKGGRRKVNVNVGAATPGDIRIDGTAIRGSAVSVVREAAQIV